MTAKKMTKGERIDRANDYRTKIAAQMGAVASGNTYALPIFRNIADGIMSHLGLEHFASGQSSPFVGLIKNALDNGYRPTLRGDLDPLYTVLADCYDFEMARRGNALRAYRG